MADVNILDHELLSEAARTVAPKTLEAYGRVAARMLNVGSLNPEDPAVRDAVAFQVNLLVELDPQFGILTSVTRGGKAETYNDTLKPPLSPMAVSILQGVAGWPGAVEETTAYYEAGEWATLTSLRRLRTC
jgi:hypothetical protein